MSNLYIRLKTGFFSHIKTARLHARIGDDAFWIPPRLWAYAAENKPDGDFSSFSSEEMASVIGCVKYAPSIREALQAAGFMDADGKIHGWQKHNEYHEKFSQRARNAALAMHEQRRAKKKGKNQRKEGEGEGKEESGVSSTLACSTDATSIATGTKAIGILSEVLEFVKELELPETDGHWFFWKCEGSGWTNNKQPIKDWRATLRSWKAGGFLPSQKLGARNGNTHNGAEPVTRSRFQITGDIVMVEKRIEEIKAQTGWYRNGDGTWDKNGIKMAEADVATVSKLRSDVNTLKAAFDAAPA